MGERRPRTVSSFFETVYLQLDCVNAAINMPTHGKFLNMDALRKEDAISGCYQVFI